MRQRRFKKESSLESPEILTSLNKVYMVSIPMGIGGGGGIERKEKKKDRVVRHKNT